MDIWGDFLCKEDRAVYTEKRMERRIGFGLRPAVLVIDMSRPFVNPICPIALDQEPLEVVRSIKVVISAARQNRVPVLFTTQRAPRNNSDWGFWKGMDLSGESDFRNEKTWEIIPELSPESGESILYKSRPSGFFGTDLANLLIYLSVDTVIVTGMTTSGCVRATVVDAFSFNFRVIVPSECVADHVSISHKVSLMDMHIKYADVVPMEEVLQFLNGFKRGCLNHS